MKPKVEDTKIWLRKLDEVAQGVAERRLGGESDPAKKLIELLDGQAQAAILCFPEEDQIGLAVEYCWNRLDDALPVG
jgi:hypothetical protein